MGSMPLQLHKMMTKEEEMKAGNQRDAHNELWSVEEHMCVEEHNRQDVLQTNWYM